MLTWLSRHRLEAKYGLLGSLALAAVVVIGQANALTGLDESIESAVNTVGSLGAIGIFAVALAGNASLLVQVPYTLPLLAAAVAGASLPRMLLLGLAAGLGAGCGEVVSYWLADKVLSLNPRLGESSTFQWVQRNAQRRPRLAAAIVFVWAASVLPDDTVIIPLAMVRYGLRRIWFPLFAGKLVHNLVIASVFYGLGELWSSEGAERFQANLSLAILVGFFLVILYQVEKARAVRASSVASAEPERPVAAGAPDSCADRVPGTLPLGHRYTPPS